jgi:hypothetical protein
MGSSAGASTVRIGRGGEAEQFLHAHAEKTRQQNDLEGRRQAAWTPHNLGEPI